MATSSTTSGLFSILNSTEYSSEFQDYLLSLNVDPSQLEYSSYPDIKYLNLKQSGISFQFEPPSNQPITKDSEWRLTAIDLYNPIENEEKDIRRKENKNPWKRFQFLPIEFTFTKKLTKQTSSSNNDEMKTFSVSKDTNGIELVSQLGEPDRKGGGNVGNASGMGPSSWLEWNLITILNQSDQSIIEKKENNQKIERKVEFKLMIELNGKESRGSERWELEKGGKSTWGVMTISSSSSA